MIEWFSTSSYDMSFKLCVILPYQYFKSNKKRKITINVPMFLKYTGRKPDYKNKIILLVQNNSLKLNPTQFFS